MILTVVSRLILLGKLPAGVNQDEAMLSMDAWALSKYGTDRFGMPFPVHFTAWDVGQMSTLLGYLMVPFIKLLGFSTFSVRLPMVIVSSISVWVIYEVAKTLYDERIGLFVMFLTAINPWHFIQSRWSLDCNLFPHVFLIGFLLLLKGLKDKKLLYLSMVFFGLTFYCYGIAVYTVPLFLFVFALWCLVKKQLRIRDVLIAVLIFMIIAGPEIVVMVINTFKYDSVRLGPLTLPFFPNSGRSSDILFLNFSRRQLLKNAMAMTGCVFLQKPDYIFNTIPFFGPLYHISIPFMLIGIIRVVKEFFTSKEVSKRYGYLALIGFLLSGIWVGLVTLEVNVNRINIIFYPLIILTGLGIDSVLKFAAGRHAGTDRYAEAAYSVIGIYCVLAIAFFICYGTYYRDHIRSWFSANFLEAVAEADKVDDESPLYITSSMETQTNRAMSEILTQYSVRIDSKYLLGETDTLNGRALPSYNERYHFVDMVSVDFSDAGIYVLKKGEKDLPSDAVIIGENETYMYVRIERQDCFE